MKHLLIILSFLLLSSPLFGQSERPETIIIPVSSLGDVSEVRKQILHNTLTNELKKHFRIVPQEKYEQVLEQVFQELEFEECSEDTCIMRVQEMLQVENVFNLQIIGEGKDSQLNLKWITFDEKKNETDYCEGCNTKKLNDKVRGLVEKLVGVKRVEVVIEKKGKGVLYQRYVNNEFGWYKNGDEKRDGKYVGEIQDGKPNGQGTWNNPLGENKYIGEYKDGIRSQGTETYGDGSKYVGEFGKYNRHGEGTMFYSDGTEYNGEWKNDEKNGQGSFTWSGGHFVVGQFKNDRPWNTKSYNKKGELQSDRFVNGKFVKH